MSKKPSQDRISLPIEELNMQVSSSNSDSLINRESNVTQNNFLDEINNHLPFFFRGHVVCGFKRGGRSLNCPTANLDSDAVDSLSSSFVDGIYAGFVKVHIQDLDSKRLWPMVMSVGYNPHFNNKKRTLEVHILRSFSQDFYGALMEGVVINYIRPMKSFNSLQELIEAIEKDKQIAKSNMNESLRVRYQEHKFFK